MTAIAKKLKQRQAGKRVDAIIYLSNFYIMAKAIGEEKLAAGCVRAVDVIKERIVKSV